MTFRLAQNQGLATFLTSDGTYNSFFHIESCRLVEDVNNSFEQKEQKAYIFVR
jgi:hypothetical protein